MMPAAMRDYLQSPTVWVAATVGLLLIVLLVMALRRRKQGAPEAEGSLEAGPRSAPPQAPTPTTIHDQPTAPVTARMPSALAPGLAKTRAGFVARIGGLLGKKHIDESLLGELEEILFTADIGARTAERLLERVRERLAKKELSRGSAVLQALKEEARKILEGASEKAGPFELSKVGQYGRPFVLLTIGVNGVGKTTSIGKIGAKLTATGKRVLFAAGDTFRAAAAEQLQIWAQRASAELVRGKEGTDPSSVVFDAIKRGQSDGFDVVIADTAGRLHTKNDLMQELQKVRRVIQKAMPEAPHETFLVLDATNGQNAIQQATLFKEAVAVTGIVLTKLDGTAKGGVVLGICEELSVPVRFVGIGEQIDDLRPFRPDEFVSALFDEAISEAERAEAA
jgi:fused signal recognition particle receptor